MSVEVDLFGNPLPPPARPGRKRHVATPALQERVRTLRGEGLSIKAVADLVGISRCTLIRVYAAELGSQSQAALRYEGKASPLPRGRPRHTPTSASRTLVRGLWAEGQSLAAIAREVGLSPKTLARHYRAELAHSVKDDLAR